MIKDDATILFLCSFFCLVRMLHSCCEREDMREMVKTLMHTSRWTRENAEQLAHSQLSRTPIAVRRSDHMFLALTALFPAVKSAPAMKYTHALFQPSTTTMRRQTKKRKEERRREEEEKRTREQKLEEAMTPQWSQTRNAVLENRPPPHGSPQAAAWMACLLHCASTGRCSQSLVQRQRKRAEVTETPCKAPQRLHPPAPPRVEDEGHGKRTPRPSGGHSGRCLPHWRACVRKRVSRKEHTAIIQAEVKISTSRSGHNEQEPLRPRLSALSQRGPRTGSEGHQRTRTFPLERDPLA